MLSAKRGIERCIFELPGPGLANNKIRKSRHLQRSTPSVKVGVRTRNPWLDYHFHRLDSTIVLWITVPGRTGPRRISTVFLNCNA